MDTYAIKSSKSHPPRRPEPQHHLNTAPPNLQTKISPTIAISQESRPHRSKQAAVRHRGEAQLPTRASQQGFRSFSGRSLRSHQLRRVCRGIGCRYGKANITCAYCRVYFFSCTRDAGFRAWVVPHVLRFQIGGFEIHTCTCLREEKHERKKKTKLWDGMGVQGPPFPHVSPAVAARKPPTSQQRRKQAMRRTRAAFPTNVIRRDVGAIIPTHFAVEFPLFSSRWTVRQDRRSSPTTWVCHVDLIHGLGHREGVQLLGGWDC
jgi:hypothetical protein